ncbi:peptide chain release factor N(5)-glutamine methyltransferase [Rhodoferax antarcticus]|uniref:peptide chain release factor N(5)-glutamine methyltransferase n=1 Tax=Rhodoferax antarcticus TaxID=81479 RepID=UPI00222416E2|nr:peptide chain release factor N(5)-glutamine methyltransferase [Rhodoferax antarcticus]MCW2310762.1 release factor glutamine methyltransferase [Rhodoferax antarcticus]
MTLLANSSIDQALTALQSRGLERLDAQLLLLHVLGIAPTQRGWLMAHDTDPLPLQCVPALQALALRRTQGEPLAYLTGSKAFYGLALHVTPDVLVPRPDTETLVDWALEVLPDCHQATVGATAPQANHPANPAPRVLDLGTGSGAIALALKATRSALQMWATDQSAAALAVAKANAQRLQLEVSFSQGAWLAALPADAPAFDCIVSNPPYIPEHDPHLAALTFEPTQALTSGVDGLDDIRHIVAAALAHLKLGGWLLLEHGFDHAVAVQHLLAQQGFTSVQSRNDLAGIARCTGGQKPCYD